ncbi:MAG TPA: NAD(P)-dependent oxidoreductase [Thermodesulfobacteriota bacterium]|nr:NAD(P)-dependent oxidoreductase [Thermodesulfobacteriota bacterium]
MEQPVVGFIGVGRMGRPMAEHCLRKGHAVAVMDVNPDAVAALVAAGARAARSPAELARLARTIVVMVVDDAQVREVVLGEEGVVQGAAAGTAVAICTSASPVTCQEVARAAAERGVAVIDAPVTGGARGADRGTLNVLCGGEAAVVDRFRPVFAAFARHVFHLGGVGAGQVGKSVNNLLLWANIVADYEALTYARAHPFVDLEQLWAATMAGSGANAPLRDWGRQTIRWADKDLDVLLDEAQALGLSLPLTGLVDQLIKTIRPPQMHRLLPPRPEPEG